MSNRGSSGILKSPPSIRIPSWKVERRRVILRKKGIWKELGLYIFANVIGVFLYVPLRKIYLPCSSKRESVILMGTFFESNIETPLDFDIGEVAWKLWGKK